MARAAGAGEPARARILRAARELFYREGIRAVGIEAVVSEARTTKMSLYRHFASKDELVAACLAERVQAFWAWFDGVIARQQGDARDGLEALFAGLAERATQPGFRGCPMTNAAIEFPLADHPGRKISEANKRELWARLERLAVGAGARAPGVLADALLILFEGCYASSQTFGKDGPAGSVAIIAGNLLDVHCGPARREAAADMTAPAHPRAG